MTETHNESTPPVLIAGAGLPGLSLAAILTHNGVPFILFQAGPRHDRCQDYGITLRRRAYEPFLRTLGEVDTQGAIGALRRSVAVDAAIGGVGRIEAAITDANTGELIVPYMTTGGIGEGNVQWQAKVADVRADHRGVIVQLEGGRQLGGRCLVAADGVNSTVRSILLPSAIPKPLPAVVYNWQRTISRPAYDNTLASYLHGTNVLLGVSHGVNVELSITDIGDCVVKIGLTLNRRYDPAEPPSPRQDLTTIHADIQREYQRCGDLVFPYKNLLTWLMSDGDKLYCSHIRSLRISKWDLDRTCERRVFQTGNAAHATPDFASESVSHGLLDGVEPAALLAKEVNGEEVSRVGRKFYHGAAERWYQGIEESENMMKNLRCTNQEWRDAVKVMGGRRRGGPDSAQS